MLQVDLRAPTIPQTQRVWRLFPGSGYQFLEAFEQEGVGFLNFPGLEFPKGKLAEADDWIPRIVRSQHVADALWQGDDTRDVGDLASFADARATQNRGRLRQAIINFFEEAKDGDFVVLPEPVYMSKILVGRFKSDDRVRVHYKPYGRFTIPAREITWFGRYAENTVSTALSEVLRHQHPFSLVERDRFLEVFALAYGSFIYGDRHAATVYNQKNDFIDADAALLGIVSRLAAAACYAQDVNRPPLAKADLVDVLLNAPPIEYTCSQQADIHSPGFNRYISGTVVALVIGAVVAALIALSGGSKDQTAVDGPALSVINTSPNADPQCTARVSEATKMILKALGTDRTWVLCEAARAAQQRAGLKSSAVPSTKN